MPDDFLLDFGIFSEKLKLNKKADGKNIIQVFPFVHFANLRRSSDDLYDSQTVVDLGDEQELLLTLAFDAERYAQLLKILPQEVSIQLADAMKRFPYHCALTTKEPIYISLVGILSDRLHTSTTHQFDQYRPLIVTEVLGDSSHDVKHML